MKISRPIGLSFAKREIFSILLVGGLEGTPLFRDGVLYSSADYARTFAVDAKSGNIIWRYEPEYEEGFAAMLCCGPIHRGLATKGDVIYVNRLDAQLVALP